MKQLITELKSYWNGFLSLIYPNYCVICSKELNSQENFFCLFCKEDLHYTYFEDYKEYTPADEVFFGRLPLEATYALLYFEKENSTQKILHQIKYMDNHKLCHFMGEKLGEKLMNFEKVKDVDALIPIPLHSKKEFSRGYNQSLLIAQGIFQKTAIPIIETLYRKKHDESQTRKSKEERFQNVKGKFAVKENKLSHCQHVLIVDDVLTTGATLEFAAKAILEQYPTMKISVATIAFAHS